MAEGHDEDEKFNGVDGVGELLPPADSAFEENAVLFDVDVGGLRVKTFPQSGGEVLAVCTGVREKDAAALAAGHDSYYSSSFSLRLWLIL